MSYYREYLGYEVHLQESVQSTQKTPRESVIWKVVHFGAERANGIAETRQGAYYAACASIDEFEADPHRFPVSLVGYPHQSAGEVVTSDGEVLGRWRLADYEELELVEFIPLNSEEVLFCEHSIGLLCSNIREWHEGDEHK